MFAHFQSLNIFLNNDQSLKAFLNIDQSLTHPCDTHVFMLHTNHWMIVVSFVGPSSDSGHLILRLRHSATQPDITLTVLGTLLTLAIPESITIDNIHLHPIGNTTSQLSFMPNSRNNLVLQTSIPTYGYVLHDLQLLDEGTPG
jgi:hypothetical protein